MATGLSGPDDKGMRGDRGVWGLRVAAAPRAEGRGPPRPLEGASVYPQCRASVAGPTGGGARLGKSAETMNVDSTRERAHES